jgi:hypothetical protein
MKRIAFALVLAFLPVASAQAGQCVLMVDAPGGRTLVNTCGTCRTAKIEALRPGSSTPIYRNYTLAEKSRMPLPLKGPNRARVVGDEACASATDTAPQSPMQHCLTLTASKQGEPVLLNACDSCRTAMLEWRMPEEVLLQENATVVAKSFTALKQKDDALQVRIVSERDCRQ